MKVLQNNFAKAHLFVFLGIWLGFTALTYWIAEHGIDQDNHRRLIVGAALSSLFYGGAPLVVVSGSVITAGWVLKKFPRS